MTKIHKQDWTVQSSVVGSMLQAMGFFCFTEMKLFNHLGHSCVYTVSLSSASFYLLPCFCGFPLDSLVIDHFLLLLSPESISRVPLLQPP